jgi:hypothetical protein
MREFERDVDVGDLLYSARRPAARKKMNTSAARERRPARKKMMKDDVRGYFL